MSDYSYANFVEGNNYQIEFDSNDFSILEDDQDFSISWAMSLSSWDDTTDRYIFDNLENDLGWSIYIRGTSTGVITLYLDYYPDSEPSGGHLFSFENIIIENDRLYYFTINVEDNVLSLYVDSVLHSTSSDLSSFEFSDEHSFIIGRKRGSLLNDFDGGVDSFAFYGGGFLSSTGISDFYNKGYGSILLGTEDYLTFALNFNEGTGLSTYDIVDNVEGILSNELIWEEGGVVPVLSPSDIKFYLTSLTPDMVQSNYSQSIGGFCSDSLLYSETTLESNLGLYDMSMILGPPDDGFVSWLDVKYLNIGSEIIEIDGPISGNTAVSSRGVNSNIQMHIIGDVVRGFTTLDVFNKMFNDDYSQYRCFAVKNTSKNVIAQNISIYLSQNSLSSKTDIELAIEIPKFKGSTGLSSSWSRSMLIDNSLIGLYEDNYFKDHYLRIKEGPNVGNNKVINSFDSATGTFVFYESWNQDYDSSYSSELSYEIDISPAQRIKSGTIDPIENENISSFASTSSSDPIYINFYDDNSDLGIGEIFYVWVKRTIDKNSDEFENDSFIISINYSKK